MLKLAELTLGVILLASAMRHIANPYAFLESVLSYQLVTGSWAMGIAMAVPYLQLTGAAALLFGVMRAAAAYLATGLLLLFTIVQISAWLRGLKIDCGCFGPFGSLVSPKTILFTLTLFVIALWVANCHSRMPWTNKVRLGQVGGRGA